jgi:uncharacterized integral membrane protein
MTSQPPAPEPGADPAPDRTAPVDGTRPYDERPYDERAPDRPVAPPRPGDLQPEPERAPADLLPQHRIRRTRAGGLWVAVAAAALVLLFLLIFILQNSQQVQVSFFGADGHLVLGVAMLLSAVAGALLVVLVGTARIVQLRLVARRHRSRDAAVLGEPDQPPRRRFARNRG